MYISAFSNNFHHNKTFFARPPCRSHGGAFIHNVALTVDNCSDVVYNYRYNELDGSIIRYYYEKNLMGDIIGIYDENGSKVAGYIYDAWGNCTVQTYGTDARIGEVNPFRYRGYYYDSDIGLYYLKSRYYDAKVGRFINADGIEYLGANGDLAAYNLFAYCSDSPTNYTDSTGNTIDFSAALDWIDKEIIQPLFSILDDLVTDLKNYDKYNESEQVVLESNYFSSYKGVPVIRTNGDRSGSYGAIFLTRETNNRKHPEDVVRHEYGHTKQLEELGLVKYTVCILLPSWQEWGTGEYYSKPWEITADIYGQVQSREHDEEDIERGWKYFDNVKKIGALSLLLIE